jgi:hypothetical protein
LTNSDLYWKHLHTIAMNVKETDRFQPRVHFTNETTPLEFSIVDTATTDDFGDPVCVALPDSLMEAIETAWAWTLVPARAGNDWSGLLAR